MNILSNSGHVFLCSFPGGFKILNPKIPECTSAVVSPWYYAPNSLEINSSLITPSLSRSFVQPPIPLPDLIEHLQRKSIAPINLIQGWPPTLSHHSYSPQNFFHMLTYPFHWAFHSYPAVDHAVGPSSSVAAVA